jgi:hypothetical protein
VERQEPPDQVRGDINDTPEDDDLSYTLLALKVVEEHGRIHSRGCRG